MANWSAIRPTAVCLAAGPGRPVRRSWLYARAADPACLRRDGLAHLGRTPVAARGSFGRNGGCSTIVGTILGIPVEDKTRLKGTCLFWLEWTEELAQYNR